MLLPLVSIPERVLEALKPYKNGKEFFPVDSRVSIPERVLEALKPRRNLASKEVCAVSIPERVLEALKHQRVF